jgi:membrane protein
VVGDQLVRKVRQRYEGSLPEAFVQRLNELDFMNTIVLFGGAFLFSMLPLIILMSSFADARVDAGLTHHLGLNARAASIVQDLFDTNAGHPVAAIVLAMLVSLAGVFTVASCVQTSYEKIFGQAHQSHGNAIRLFMWLLALSGWLVYDAVVSEQTHRLTAGVLLGIVAVLVGSLVFFWFSMHLLLAGSVSWCHLLVPAMTSAVFWVGLSIFARIYFSSSVLTDTQLYGKVGAVFDLLTWFVAIAAVVILGALSGELVQERQARTARLLIGQPRSGSVR